MVSAALRGMGKVLAKHLRKAPALGKRVRGAPTKAGLTARRAALRGETLAEQARGVIPKGVKKKTLKSEIERVKPAWKGLALGIAGTLTVQEIRKKQKEAKAKEKEKKEKLKKSTEEHKKEDEKRKKAYGKRAPKKSINYGGK